MSSRTVEKPKGLALNPIVVLNTRQQRRQIFVKQILRTFQILNSGIARRLPAYQKNWEGISVRAVHDITLFEGNVMQPTSMV